MGASRTVSAKFGKIIEVYRTQYLVCTDSVIL
jgi:hypothetical protein